MRITGGGGGGHSLLTVVELVASPPMFFRRINVMTVAAVDPALYCTAHMGFCSYFPYPLICALPPTRNSRMGIHTMGDLKHVMGG